MKKIVHLVPYDGIGGVERAAASSEGASSDNICIKRLFVFDDVKDRSERLATWNPITMWRAAGRLVLEGPSLVVLSLWRSVLVGGLAWLRGCRAPMVLFLHNTQDSHALDRWITRCSAQLVAGIWADSSATLQKRLSIRHGMPTRVISFLVAHQKPVRSTELPPTPNFVFWGRLAPQKDHLRALAIFDKLRKHYPTAMFDIIGPNGGMKHVIELEILKRGLLNQVQLIGPLDHEGIEVAAARASFYLQTSHYEGMALSVIEAMQAGLVAVVTPVGEISRYTEDGISAVWIKPGAQGEDETVEDICSLLQDESRWRSIQSAAIARWSDQPIYADDVLCAAKETLNLYPTESEST